MERGLLSSSRIDVLRAFPLLEFVQWHPRARDLLAAFPRDQTRPPRLEGKARGSSERFELLADNHDEMQLDQRFAQFAADNPPCLTDQVQAREIDALVWAIGRCRTAPASQPRTTTHLSASIPTPLPCSAPSALSFFPSLHYLRLHLLP